MVKSANEYFKIGSLVLKNRDSSMKIGTDSILLGKWIEPLPDDKMMLDIGTGTGIIALMAAEKRSAAVLPEAKDFTIYAIDIDEASVEEARFNFDASSWKDCLKGEKVSLRDFAQKTSIKFDYIFSNPPFFSNSLKAPDARRSNARHSESLPYEEIISAAFTLLRRDGRIAVILPSEEAKKFQYMAEFYHIGREENRALNLTRIEKVQTSHNKPAKRWLMEFTLR
jgi:tRNA1Val (adenine37-N6)-methyltransferase